jgi:hypothetical protein
MASIGTTLREERIRLGLGIDQVEADTKIRAKYLMALEDERFEALPGTAYARAFLRDYAEQLGLDPQELVNRLNQISGFDDDVVLAPRRPVGPGPILGRGQRVALGGAVVVLVVLLAVAAYVVLASGGSGGATAGAAVGGSAGTDLASATTPEAPAKKRAALIRAVFRAGPGSTWLEVRKGSARGKVLYARVLAAGSRIRVAGRRLWVDAGAPWNLSLKVNGHRRAVPTHPSGHLLVTRSGVHGVA